MAQPTNNWRNKMNHVTERNYIDHESNIEKFDVRIYGAGYMGSDLALQATTKQIQGLDGCDWWNGVLEGARSLPIGNAAGHSIKHLEIMPLDPSSTMGGRPYHTVVTEGTCKRLAHVGSVGLRTSQVLATVSARTG